MKRIFLIIWLSIITLTSFAQIDHPVIEFNLDMPLAPGRRIDVDAQGRYIIVGLWDQTARLYDARTGKLLHIFRVPVNENQNARVEAVAISPDARIIVIGGYTYYKSIKSYVFFVYDRQNYKMLFYVRTPFTIPIEKIAFSPDGQYLAVAQLNNKIIIYKTNLNEIKNLSNLKFTQYKILSGYKDYIAQIAFDSTGRMATSCFDKKIRLYDKNFNLIAQKNTDYRLSGIAFSPDGKKIAAAYHDIPKVDVFSGKDLSYLYSPNTKGIHYYSNGLSTNSLIFSRDGKYLFFGSKYIKDFYGIKKSIIRRWDSAGLGSFKDFPVGEYEVDDMELLPDGDIIFFDNYPALGRMDTAGNIKFYKVAPIYNYFRKDHKPLLINNDGSQIVILSLSREPIAFNLKTRQVSHATYEQLQSFRHYTEHLGRLNVKYYGNSSLKKFLINNKDKTNQIKQFLLVYIANIDILPDTNRILIVGNYDICLIDSTGKLIWKEAVPQNIAGGVVSGDGKFAVVAMGDGELAWYRISDGKLLFTLYINPENKKWILYTPEGYYDCSPGAENWIGWLVNRGLDKNPLFFTLNQFYKRFYIPGLGQRLLSGDTITLGFNMKDFLLPPHIEILSPEDKAVVERGKVRVKLRAEDLGGGVKQIRLYVNGKLSASRNVDLSNGKSSTYTFTVHLANGNNVIRAVALNSQSTESQPAEIEIFYKTKLPPQPDIYILAMGINNYLNPMYNLNYATQDAGGFVKAMKSATQGIFQQRHIYYLSDSMATKQNLLKAIDSIKSSIRPQDVFVFYYAGHGLVYNSDYYLVPYDITDIFGGQLEEDGISAQDLQQITTDLTAQKQLYILDACYSGTLTHLLASTRGFAYEKAISDLAHSTGTFWLTSSNPDQYASEIKTLGHGVFSYAIIMGLQGAADSNNDLVISVKELSEYVRQEVPRLSRQFRTYPQFPTAYSSGKDFPLGVVKE